MVKISSYALALIASKANANVPLAAGYVLQDKVIVEGPDEVGPWIEANFGSISADEFHNLLVRNTGKIDWGKFKDWQGNTEVSDKYEDLLEGFEGWEDAETLPWDEVADEIEDGTIEGEEFDWVMENHDRINPSQFNEWKDLKFSAHVYGGPWPGSWIGDVLVVQALNGRDDWLQLERLDYFIATQKSSGHEINAQHFYGAHKKHINWDLLALRQPSKEDKAYNEWLYVLLGRRAEKELANLTKNKRNLDSDGKLDMESITNLIDVKRYYMDSNILSQFLIENFAKLDFDELEDWAEKVWEQDGYEWLHEIDNNGPGSWGSS